MKKEIFERFMIIWRLSERRKDLYNVGKHFRYVFEKKMKTDEAFFTLIYFNKISFIIFKKLKNFKNYFYK